MRGRVLVVALCGVPAAAFLATPTNAVRGKWCLGTARTTVKLPSVVRSDGGSGGGEGRVPNGGSGGSEDSGDDGGEEKKQFALIDVEAMKKIYEKSASRMPSGDLITIFGLILTSTIFLLIRIDDVGKDLAKDIDTKIGKLDSKIGNLDIKLQLSTVVTWVALAYLVSASNKT